MSTTTTPATRGSKTPIILAAAAGVVALIVVLVLVLGGGDDADYRHLTLDPLAAEVSVDGTALDPLLPDGADTAIGAAAPALTGTDYEEAPVSVTPGADGPTLLVFLAHWCPHCNAEIPVLNEWRDAGGVPDDLRVVGVSTAVAADRPNYPPGEWLEKMDWQWDVIADGQAPAADQAPPAATAYGVTGFPFFVLLDGDGNVVRRGSGELSSDALDELVASVSAPG